MSAILSLTESQTLASLRALLLDILPAGWEVVKAQDNEVPAPTSPNYVIMTPVTRARLATNLHTDSDCYFNASIAGNVMAVDVLSLGALVIGATLFGLNVPAGVTITGQTSGPAGGAGSYTLSQSLPLAEQAFACGLHNMLESVDVGVQLDVHGPGSSDMAQVISTAFRDSYACDFMAALGPDVAPLYADDPRQSPFVDDQGLVEYRWTVDAHLQANPVISTPQQFAGTLKVGLIPVDLFYPA